MTINITVNGQHLSRNGCVPVVADSINYVKADFTFTSEWDGLVKTAVFKDREGNAYNVLLVDDECIVPHEVLKSNYMRISVFGTPPNSDTVLLVTATDLTVSVRPSGYKEGETPPEPTPAVYQQIVGIMEQQKVDATAAGEYTTQAQGYAEQAELSAEQAGTHAANANTSELNAKQSELNAKDSETNAGESETVTTQAMADLLAMLGSDVATLTNGKLTPSQIPHIAITDTFVAATEAAMLALDCQTGDICIRTDENKTYILQGTIPSDITHWQQLKNPTNYADEAGHAQTAANAENSDKVNGKRIIGMTQSQYESAVLSDDTFYFVTPDEV